MSASQRNKGAKGEREVANLLSEQLGWVVRRNIGQARDGGDDLTIGQFRVEVKRKKGIAVHAFMDQVAAACGPTDVPMVVMRGDGKGWLVMLRLEDAVPLIREALPER
jgi:Holliday junction resolvase